MKYLYLILSFIIVQGSFFYSQELGDDFRQKEELEIATSVKQMLYQLKDNGSLNKLNKKTGDNSSSQLDKLSSLELKEGSEMFVKIKSIEIKDNEAIASCEISIDNHDTLSVFEETINLNKIDGSWTSEIAATTAAAASYTSVITKVKVIQNSNTLIQEAYSKNLGIWEANKNLANSKLSKNLFSDYVSAGGDLYYYNSNNNIAGFIADPVWDRIIYGNSSSLAVNSYGDFAGHYVFDNPTSLVTDDNGYVYVADKNHHKIVKLKYNTSTDRLSFIKTISVPGLYYPEDISFGRGGYWGPERLLILDKRKNRIIVTNTEGTIVSEIKSLTFGGQPLSLLGITNIVSDRDMLYVCLVNKQKHQVIIAEFSSDLSTLTVTKYLQFPTGCDFGKPGVSSNYEFVIPDRNLNVLHFIDQTMGYIVSAKHDQLINPTFVSNVAGNIYQKRVLQLYVSNPWQPDNGIVRYLKSADVIDIKYTGFQTTTDNGTTYNSLKFSFYPTSYCSVKVQLLNSANTVIKEELYYWAIQKQIFTVPYSLTPPGGYKLRVQYKSLYDDSYGDYKQGWKTKEISCEIYSKLPNVLTSSDTRSYGTYYCDGLTIKNNSTLTLGPGLILKIGDLRSIIVEPGSKLICNGTSAYPVKILRGNSEMPWTSIELRGDGNQFTYTLFDGGETMVKVKSLNNTFTNCTFRNGNDGIWTYQRYNRTDWSSYTVKNCLFTDNNSGITSQWSTGYIIGTEIRNSYYDGLRIYNSRVGESTADGGTFRNNYIHDNKRYGIWVEYEAKLWMGTGQFLGKNRICNNNQHEIYLGSNYAYLFQSMRSENGSRGSGYNDIYDTRVSSYYLIYNLAKTYDGANYISIVQLAENNFWNTCGSPSGWIYGPVDFTPYKSGMVASVSTPSVPLNIETTTSSSPTQVLTANMVSAFTEGVDAVADQNILDIKQRMLDLRNTMRKNPDDPYNSRRMNELFGLIGVIGKDKSIEDMEALKQFSSDRNTYYASNRNNIKHKENLLGETSMMLEVADKLRDEEYSAALSLIDKYDIYIVNADNRRDFLMHKLTALQSMGRYSEALMTLADIKKVVQDDGSKPGYTPPTFETIESSINSLIKAQANSKANYSQIAVIEIPETFNLNQNYPNPFNPSTNIQFGIPEVSNVKMEVFDITGRLITILTNKDYDAGNHTIVFNGKGLASGVYILRANLIPSSNPNAKHQFTKKMMLLK